MEQKVLTVMQRVKWPNSKNGMSLSYDLTPQLERELSDGWEVITTSTATSSADKDMILTVTYLLQR